MKKKSLTTTIIIIMILAGLSLMLYPTLSDYLKSLAYRRAIENFTATVETLAEDTYEDLLEDARAYNARLAERGFFTPELSESERAEYESLLRFTDDGIMGYVEIPKVNISLPIYHGTGDNVLQSGVGHLEGSSLPVGGENTHAALSGHTGLPSAKLFTDIDQLAVGDIFTLRVLRETFTYEVDQILTVLPNELDALDIETGQDYCTLVTCTPYGINTHRLLVRGHRIETPPEEEQPDAPSAAVRLVPWIGMNLKMLALTGASCVVALILIIIALRRRKRR